MSSDAPCHKRTLYCTVGFYTGWPRLKTDPLLLRRSLRGRCRLQWTEQVEKIDKGIADWGRYIDDTLGTLKLSNMMS